MSDRKTPEELRAEIEETRERLSEDIDELGYRLSPEGLKEQAQSTLRDAQDVLTGATEGVVNSLNERMERFGNDLLKRIRENPLPATLLGAGVGWLLMQGSRQPEGTEAGYGRAASYLADPDRGSGIVLDDSGRAMYRTRRAPPLQDLMRENPAAVGIGVLLAGLAIGLLAPGTRREDRLMGGARERFLRDAKRDAKETARQAGRRVRETARDAQHAVKEEAQKRGLTKKAYSFDADRDHFREHHRNTYKDTDFSYEDYEPAYRYGTVLGSEDRYHDRPWDDALEAELRGRWEGEQRASWDNFGGAVRYGYERSRSRL